MMTKRRAELTEQTVDVTVIVGAEYTGPLTLTSPGVSVHEYDVTDSTAPAAAASLRALLAAGGTIITETAAGGTGTQG